jgi:hypothetical protein
LIEVVQPKAVKTYCFVGAGTHDCHGRIHVANLSINNNLKATNWAKGVKEGQFLHFQDHPHQQVLASTPIRYQARQGSSNKLFGRLAYEHFKKTIDVCMMYQDVNVAMVMQRQWCHLHLSSATRAATSDLASVTIKDKAEASCAAAVIAAATALPPQTACAATTAVTACLVVIFLLRWQEQQQ